MTKGFILSHAQGLLADAAKGWIYEVRDIRRDRRKYLHGAYNNMAPPFLSINKDIDLIRILLYYICNI